MNKDKATLRGALRRVRALAMLKAKLTSNLSNKLVAQQFNVSKKTLERNLNFALREGLLESYEDQLLKDLVPEALSAAKRAMQEGDATVAMEILKGAGILKKPIDKNRSSEGGEGDSLEIYLRRKRELPPQASPSSQPPLVSHGGDAQLHHPLSLSPAPAAQSLREALGLDDLPGSEGVAEDVVGLLEGELVGPPDQRDEVSDDE